MPISGDEEYNFLRQVAEYKPDKAHHYVMLASAIAGYPVHIVYQADRKQKAYNDGQIIFLPDDSEDHGLEVMIQALLMGGDSLDPATLLRFIGRARAARRYLYLEVHRHIYARRHSLPGKLLRTGDISLPVFRSESRQHSLEVSFGKLELPPTPEIFGIIKPFRVFGGGRPVKKDVSAQELEVKEDDDGEGESSKLLKLFSNPLMSNGFLSKLLRDILGGGMEPDKGEEEGAAGDIAARQQKRIKQRLKSLLSLSPFSLSTFVPEREAGTAAYPEWDILKQAYKKDWTFVAEYIPQEEDEDEENGRTVISGLSNGIMRKNLARLGLNYEPHRGQPQGGDIDIDDLIRLIIDSRTGHSADERIYHAPLKTRRDLGVFVLLDISDSVGEIRGDGTTVHEDQLKVACQLTQILEQLGDRVAFYGYHSWGRGHVRLAQVKSFEERMGGDVLERAACLLPSGFTRTGAAIRHASALIERDCGMPHKLLVVISDGLAYDDGYEGKYGEGDTAHALQEARDRGIGCVCLSIGSDVETERLQNIFGTASHLSVARPSEVSAKIGKLFLSAINGVARR